MVDSNLLDSNAIPSQCWDANQYPRLVLRYFRWRRPALVYLPETKVQLCFQTHTGFHAMKGNF